MTPLDRFLRSWRLRADNSGESFYCAASFQSWESLA